VHHLTPSHLFLFNDPSTSEIYTLSLHDALPISGYSRITIEPPSQARLDVVKPLRGVHSGVIAPAIAAGKLGNEIGTHLPLIGERSEEHTSELQSRENLVCRLLLEKKKRN